MGGGGHMIDMVNRFKQNRKAKEDRRARFDEFSDRTESKSKLSHTPLDFSETTNEDWEALKLEIVSESREIHNKKTILISIISVILFTIIVYLLNTIFHIF